MITQIKYYIFIFYKMGEDFLDKRFLDRYIYLYNISTQIKYNSTSHKSQDK